MGRDSATHHWKLCPFCILQTEIPQSSPNVPLPQQQHFRRNQQVVWAGKTRNITEQREAAALFPSPAASHGLRRAAHDSLLQDRRANTVSRSEQKSDGICTCSDCTDQKIGHHALRRALPAMQQGCTRGCSPYSSQPTGSCSLLSFSQSLQWDL